MGRRGSIKIEALASLQYNFEDRLPEVERVRISGSQPIRSLLYEHQ
jgi:hypothetical protein